MCAAIAAAAVAAANDCLLFHAVSLLDEQRSRRALFNRERKPRVGCNVFLVGSTSYILAKRGETKRNVFLTSLVR